VFHRFPALRADRRRQRLLLVHAPLFTPRGQTVF
jgi:hypothetical protein